MAGAEIEAGFILLRQKGWLFTFRKAWGELLYFMPRDTFAHLQPLVTSSIEKAETAIEPEAVQGRGWVWDLFHSLVYIAKKRIEADAKGNAEQTPAPEAFGNHLSRGRGFVGDFFLCA